jgi:hypothetical protein
MTYHKNDRVSVRWNDQIVTLTIIKRLIGGNFVVVTSSGKRLTIAPDAIVGLA